MSEPDDASRLADAIRTLLRTFTIDEHRYPAARGRMRYNAVDFQVLHRLSSEQDARAVDLAELLGVATTTIQSSVDRLVERGLLERTPGARDRRERRLSLTAAGKAMQADISAQDHANCSRMLDALTATRAHRLVADIETIARALEAEAAEPDRREA